MRLKLLFILIIPLILTSCYTKIQIPDDNIIYYDDNYIVNSFYIDYFNSYWYLQLGLLPYYAPYYYWTYSYYYYNYYPRYYDYYPTYYKKRPFYKNGLTINGTKREIIRQKRSNIKKQTSRNIRQEKNVPQNVKKERNIKSKNQSIRQKIKNTNIKKSTTNNRTKKNTTRKK